MTRKLASVRKITKIEPIENADLIVRAKVDGWSLVTAKTNGFREGDLAIYFEIDSFLPVEERYEFLRKSSFKSTKYLGDGFRIKTIKLKGVLSQGLLLPIEKIFDDNDCKYHYFTLDKEGNKIEIFEHQDLTEELGVKLYEKPIPLNMAGKIKGNFPLLIRKTDQERIQNLFHELKEYFNYSWEVTLKLDGSSMTVFHKYGEIGVCSRNVQLEETSDNLFWNVARKLKIPEMIKWTGKNLAFQGELMGPGVQGNREWLKEHTFFLYDIWDIDYQRYFSQNDRLNLVTSINNSGFELPHCPILIKEKKLSDFGSLSEPNNIMKEILLMAEGLSIYNPIREGIVFKRLDGQMSFKAISNAYLLNEKG